MKVFLHFFLGISFLVFITGCEEFSSHVEITSHVNLKVIHQSPSKGLKNTVKSTSNLSEESFKSLFSGNVKVNKLKKDGWDYGYSMWFVRSSKKVKAKYFAAGDVNDRFDEWKNDKKVIMVCSGAFTTGDFGKPLPVGLTVDNGDVVNKVMNDEMDGLVIIYATGGIVVSDLEQGNLFLKSLNKTVDVRDSWDKFELLKWSEQEQATIFQTQLLVYNNDLKLDVNKARKKNRERRILVLATDAQKRVLHIVFDVAEGVYLGEIAQDILNYLKSKQVKVVAMLNLDTGWYNMMKLYDKQNDLILRKNPDKSPTNLLVYYYEE